MAGFQGQISYHLPSHLLLKFAQEIPFGQKNLSQPEPVKGPTVFTDGSGKTGKAPVVWYENNNWNSKVVYQNGSPQIVELRAHGTLKQQLQKQKGGMIGEPPQACLDNVVYVLSFLYYGDNSSLPPFFNTSLFSTQNLQRGIKVHIKDLVTGQWSGPCELLTWGRGYACVSTDTGPQWTPA